MGYIEGVSINHVANDKISLKNINYQQTPTFIPINGMKVGFQMFMKKISSIKGTRKH